MNFASIVAALLGNVITINGSIAQLTRAEYYNQYVSYINTGQFVPIMYLNIFNQDINNSNTQALSILASDILSATDWIVINRTN